MRVDASVHSPLQFRERVRLDASRVSIRFHNARSRIVVIVVFRSFVLTHLSLAIATRGLALRSPPNAMVQARDSLRPTALGTRVVARLDRVVDDIDVVVVADAAAARAFIVAIAFVKL